MLQSLSQLKEVEAKAKRLHLRLLALEQKDDRSNDVAEESEANEEVEVAKERGNMKKREDERTFLDGHNDGGNGL